MEQRFAFVLRIWLTKSQPRPGHKAGSLRGTLQSVDSAELLHFSSLRQLNDLIEVALQQSDPSTTNPLSTDSL